MERQPSGFIAQEIDRAYTEMVTRRIHPLAPNLKRFRDDFWTETETQQYHLGVPDARDNAALAIGVTALRHLCGVAPEVAVELLRLAADEIESTWGMQ
ncbi:hypothetical protein H7J77_17170 [Mycolicibacillus parakoreensis]|uniref:Uncharacterized protein n=1 Tax=Mycolicibacillus parakoreensis TaxID=1069221 RepID=A0ABY3U0R6_9MYCO|nr:hypothetical protein [Mycolicibacillus parakoreensis]MCV7317268.1 hypothetical protein [Mycolicibacillus parakoreensis]ULN51520.1 hypothetical protein MIU77_11440 [Mycolicibacillus parakoreensis]